ncbi:MAG TPA: Zn-dependent hydrolase [Chloroflexota bacterium]|nr:Zn-dependent hydrolase [Chloroflexota bacterium]
MDWAKIRVDEALVATYLERLYEIGRLDGGGVWRPTYSPAWQEARGVVRGWLEEAGLTVREDAVGNLFGRLEGIETGPVILVGSHIDTVYAGGKFDGALGVVGAIVATRALQEVLPRPRLPVEVFVSCEEEDSRFICDFWGSRALLGEIDPMEADHCRDVEGVVLADAMAAFGLEPRRVGEARRNDLGCFLELHIEQGPVLEQAGISLGIVESISGLNRTAVQVVGQADHAGTTPIAMRRDAGLAAAEMLLAVRSIADELGEPARATVGTHTVYPNQPNIVPGRVEFVVDSRHPDRATQIALLDAVCRRCQEVAAKHSVTVTIKTLIDQPPTPMDPRLVATLEDCAERRQISHRRMVSGAGHDAQVIGRRVPAVMLFVPSQGGRSHSPAEHTSLEQLVPGVQILADALTELSGAWSSEIS